MFAASALQMSQVDAGAATGERAVVNVSGTTRSLGFILLDAGRLYTRRLQERSRDLALDLTGCRVLVALAENEGVTQHRLAELISSDPAALGRILDRLEADGWVERRPYPGDRRARSICSTRAAKEYLAVIWHIAKQLQLEALAGLSWQETQTLAKVLGRVLANLSSVESSAAGQSQLPQRLAS